MFEQVAAVGESRLAQAVAALAAVERRTGVRREATRLRLVASGGSPVAAAAGGAPAELRGPAGRDQTRPGQPHAGLPEGQWPVTPTLAKLLPERALIAGQVLAVQGSTSLLLSLLAAASTHGAWTCFVGAPRLGLLAASDAGLALERVTVVPEPGVSSATVVAALLDGIDLVVIGPRCPLLESDRRRLMARARERGALIAALGPWTGAHVTLVAERGTWTGVEAGGGWLRHRHLTVTRSGRGAAAWPQRFDIEVPVCQPPRPLTAPAATASREATPARLRLAS
ncbi:MAG: hypothetical protein FWG11_08625 [Promicromonosporaceae bacterium]|nr:hypothetical protein [Promicromonosporaceae bacterium]